MIVASKRLLQDILCKLHGNHKRKYLYINTKEREKESQHINPKKKSKKQRQRKTGKGQKNYKDRQKPINKLTIVYPSLSIITLNGNGLNLSMKRNRG